MGKHKKSRVVGQCLCSDKKSYKTTNAGDNYNVMPYRIGVEEDCKTWLITTSVDTNASNGENDVFVTGNYYFPGVSYVYQPPYGRVSIFDYPRKEGPQTFIWPNVFDNFRIIRDINSIIYSYSDITAPTFSYNNKSFNSLAWMNIENNNKPIVQNILDSDFLKYKSYVDTVNCSCTRYIFIPLYCEYPEYNPIQAPNQVQVGRSFPGINLEEAFPSLYQQFLDDINSYGSQQALFEDILGPPTCWNSDVDRFIYYSGPFDCSPFAKWINWKIGKSIYPPPPMDALNFSTPPGVPLYRCGWNIKPRFLYYVLELIINSYNDNSQPYYVSYEDVPDTSVYGFLIETNGNQLDSASFPNMRKVKITKKVIPHIATVQDNINAAMYLPDISPCVYNHAPTGGVYPDIDSGIGDRIDYLANAITGANSTITCEGRTYPVLYNNPYNGDFIGGSIIGSVFYEFKYDIENSNFYDDSIVAFNDDNTKMYTPSNISGIILRQDVNFLVKRSHVGIFYPGYFPIYDIKSNFSGSDTFDVNTGFNDFFGSHIPFYGQYNTPITYYSGNTNHYFNIVYSELSTLNRNFSNQFDIGVYPSIIPQTPSRKYNFRKVMGGFPYQDTGPIALLIDSNHNDIKCNFNQISDVYLGLCENNGALNPYSTSTIKYHGWSLTELNSTIMVLFCPYNNDFRNQSNVNNCNNIIDLVNMKEGRSVDSLVFSDINMYQTTVGDIPNSNKVLTTGYKQILLSDYQTSDDDNLDLNNVNGFLCSGITDNFYISTMVPESITFSTPQINSGLFSTINYLLQDLQNVVDNYTPTYYSDYNGLYSSDKKFLSFDYLRNNVVYSWDSSNPNETQFKGATNILCQYTRTFYGSDNPDCTLQLSNIEGIRGFKTSGGIWFDSAYNMYTFAAGNESNSYNYTFRALELVNEDNDYLYFESKNNVYNITQIEGYTNVTFPINFYFNLDKVFGSGSLRIECIHNDETVYAINNDFPCDTSRNGFKFEIGLPISISGGVNGTVVLQNQNFYIKSLYNYQPNDLGFYPTVKQYL